MGFKTLFTFIPDALPAVLAALLVAEAASAGQSPVSRKLPVHTSLAEIQIHDTMAAEAEKALLRLLDLGIPDSAGRLERHLNKQISLAWTTAQGPVRMDFPVWSLQAKVVDLNQKGGYSLDRLVEGIKRDSQFRFLTEEENRRNKAALLEARNAKENRK